LQLQLIAASLAVAPFNFYVASTIVLLMLELEVSNKLKAFGTLSFSNLI
jgi:hypothetical protein